MEKYEITIDNDPPPLRWDWLNILTMRFPYAVWRGTDYPFNEFLGSVSTRRKARRIIAKDRKKQKISQPEVIEID